MELAKSETRMKETLECTQCDKKWERQKARGRKPIVCPECAEVNAQEEASQKTSSYVSSQEDKEQIAYTYPPVSYWMCQNCDQTISVHVGLNHIPIHPCRLKRNQYIAFTQTTRKELKEIAV